MILIVNAENRSLFVSELFDMHRQRKTVFVDRQGWKVPVIGDMEMDDYDDADTTYLIAKANSNSAALLPHALDCGWKCACLGPTLPYGDDELTAVVASITPDGSRVSRQRLGIDSPVTRFALSTVKIAA